MDVVVIIGDIVKSRRIPDREQFQAIFQLAVKQTNEVDTLKRPASPYTVTLGDEVQAVYEDAADLFDHLLYLMGALSPAKLRFSIGVGSLTTPINPAQSIGMDGPAFHAARDGLEQQKESETLVAIWTAVDWKGPDLTADMMLVESISMQLAKWKPARWRVARKLIENLSETEVAVALRISRQAVNDHVRSGEIKFIRKAGRQIGAALTRAVMPR